MVPPSWLTRPMFCSASLLPDLPMMVVDAMTNSPLLIVNRLLLVVLRET